MSHQRRPPHLATLHHNHANNSVITHLHSPGTHPISTHSNTISHAQLVNSNHGLPATARMHGGRIVGVTGVANPTPGVRYPDQVTMKALFAQTNSQPLYSCEAPRGHDHVYQCPARDQLDHNHSKPEYRDKRNHPVDPQIRHLDDRYIDGREHNVNCHMSPEQREVAAEQRTEYHYGGSDYSSTEPIYAQPQLHPHDIPPSPSRSPPLAYTNIRGSLRNPHHHGTPARFLVRTDSNGASTSSSTLPTVSALFSVDRTSRSRTLTHDFSKANTLSNNSTPAKLKGTGMIGAWKTKYLRGNDGRKRTYVFFGLLILLLALVLGGLASVLYLTIGGGIGAIVGDSPQLVHLTEKGSSMVTVEFRITNHNYWPELSHRNSEAFQTLSRSIEHEVDILFQDSMWSTEYNRSEVVSLSGGSLVVRMQLHINTPDPLAANKLGSAFLRGLLKHHDQEWLGPYIIDIESIRFAEILVDTTSILSSTTMSTHAPPTTTRPTPRSNVGWGEWSSWSSCNPCSPQYDQIRTRQCRMDGGKGILISSIEWCLPPSHNGHLQHSEGEMQTRPCQCDHAKEIEPAVETVLKTKSVQRETTPASVQLTEITTVEETTKHFDDEQFNDNGACDRCSAGDVCVALVGEPHPKCRSPKEPADPTGCGGLCSLDAEVCQALGHRAFQCHSASQCLDDEWRCADGLCIPHAKRCDGHLNCYDRSDEIMCDCAKNEFHCGNRTSCLPLTARCDGNVDCWDGLDETNCSDGFNDSSHLPPSVIGPGRVGIPQMNRTAIGLSSLSHRERELLS